jgi:hypothetical protein
LHYGYRSVRIDKTCDYHDADADLDVDDNDPENDDSDDEIY